MNEQLSIIMIILTNLLVVIFAFFSEYLTTEQSLKQLLKDPAALFRHKKGQKLSYFVFMLTVMLVVTDLLFIKTNSLQESSSIFVFLFLEVIFMLLIFLSYFDWVKMEIPFVITILCVLIALAANFAVLLTGLNYVKLWDENNFSAVSNLLAGIAAGSFVGLIVLLTKERGMGKGDIYLAIIMGLLLGAQKSLVGFYLAIFSATGVGLYKGYKKGGIKGTRLPFVPFISFAIIVTTLFWTEIYSFLSTIPAFEYFFPPS